MSDKYVQALTNLIALLYEGGKIDLEYSRTKGCKCGCCNDLKAVLHYLDEDYEEAEEVLSCSESPSQLVDKLAALDIEAIKIRMNQGPA